MECSLCKNKAAFICKFCGRIICEDCREIKPYFTAAYDENRDFPKAIVVEDAAYCGKCNPISKPITIKELE